jgi:Wzt C-terminal domain
LALSSGEPKTCTYYCYAATTQELGHPLFELGAGERLTVRFYFNAHLTRGHYRVDLSVRDPNGAGFLLQSDGVASFTINEQITSHGLANVELKASVQRSQYSQSKIGKVR